MKKILIFTTSEGHLSIARSAEHALQHAGFKIVINQSDHLSKGFKFYLPFYRYFPFLFQVPYKLGQADAIQSTVKKVMVRTMEMELKQIIKKTKPDLIIATWMFHLPAICKILDYQTNPIPLVNIIANPWTLHPMEFCQIANKNLVYDNVGVRFARNLRIPNTAIESLGWLIRDEFYQKYDGQTTRKSLGFNNDVFTILICGGSDGTNMILKIMPGLMTIKKQCQIIVVCGTNNTLYRAINSFNSVLSHLPRTGIDSLESISERLKIKVLQFSDSMPELINAADIVMGKAGPNLLFETVAMKKPFFAICHISGQEDDNLNIIRKKKLGFVEENSIGAIKLLQKIVGNPRLLDWFKKPILKEYEYNNQAGERLVKIVKSLI